MKRASFKAELQIRIDPDVALLLVKHAELNRRSCSKEASDRLRWLFAIMDQIGTKRPFPPFVDPAALKSAVEKIR